MTIKLYGIAVCQPLPRPEGHYDDSSQRVLNENRCKYQKLVECIPAITYIAAIDATSSTLYTSPQIETLLGFSQDEWMADPILWLKQIHPDDRTYVLDELVRVQAGGDPIPCEYRMLTRDGREVWFRDEATLERDSNGCPSALYGVMLDITEQKRLEQELNVTRYRLAESVKVKLSARERAILRLQYAGRTHLDIAQELALSERTVRYALKALYQKLGVANKVEAIRMAVHMQLLD